MLDKDEIKRYARHISLENVGLDGQEKLKKAKVLVVGAGGLGAPILQYLTAAGVGTIGIIDHDVVDESNLQRQVIFTISDIGKPKVEVAVERLRQLNPFVHFQSYKKALDSSNALEILSHYDIVIDGTDNFATRYLVNDACILLDTPFVHGSIFKFQGQIAVFNYQNGPSYRCLYPEPPKASEAPNCSEIGVLGVLPGVVGTRMATECIKMILGLGKILTGIVEVVDLLENTNVQMNVQRNESNFKRTALETNYKAMSILDGTLDTRITAKDLKKRLQSPNDIVLLDVRELFELEICSLDGVLLIPLQQIPSRMHEISKTQPVVAICHHGIRSAHAINFLRENGWSNLTNLEGGMHAWAKEVDPNMATY